MSGPSAASLVSANLSSILAALMPVTQDRERKLRKLANSSVAAVLAHTPGASLAPLHALLTAHICCALTHIDPRIQQDGLTTLDCLLDQAPAFIRAAIHQLLPNCLDQISAKKKPGDKKVAGPHVAANLSESMSSLQWRVSVLTRIDRLLDAVSPSLQTSGPEAVAVQQFLPGRSYCLPRPPAAPLPLSSLTSVATSSGLQDQALLVLPLLIETWVEARALEEKQKSKSSVLPREVAELLACVSGILDKMLRLLGDKELAVVRKKFEADLVQHFLVPLPYSCPDLPCAEANTQLASVSLALAHSLPLPVLQAALKSRGASAGSRLRLVTRLLEDPALAPVLRGACVAALVQLLDTAEARERQEATRLLREEAVKRGGQEVRPWVRGLAGLLAAALEEGGDREAAGPLLESCLALAKTRNTDISETFLEATEQLSGETERGQGDMRCRVT